VLVEEREATRKLIENIIEAEQHYIFTNDLNFKENKTNDPRQAMEEGMEQQPMR